MTLPVESPASQVMMPITHIDTPFYQKGFLTIPNNHHKHIRIFFRDIVLLEGVRNYTLFHLKDGRKLISSSTLRIYEEELQKTSVFYRIHKSSIVNIIHLKDYETDKAKQVVLPNDQRVVVARRKQKDFENFLHHFLQKSFCFRKKK